METCLGTSCKTINNKSQEEVGMQQDSGGEALFTDESAPLTDSKHINYKEHMAELLAQEVYDLSMETDLEDQDCKLSPYASSRGPPIPFTLTHLENVVDYKIKQIEGLEHLVVNSPKWYSRVRPHLTKEEKEILFKRVPWSVNIYWSHTDEDDDDDENVDNVGPAATPLFKDQNNIKL